MMMKIISAMKTRMIDIFVMVKICTDLVAKMKVMRIQIKIVHCTEHVRVII